MVTNKSPIRVKNINSDADDDDYTVDDKEENSSTPPHPHDMSSAAENSHFVRETTQLVSKRADIRVGRSSGSLSQFVY